MHQLLPRKTEFSIAPIYLERVFFLPMPQHVSFAKQPLKIAQKTARLPEKFTAIPESSSQPFELLERSSIYMCLEQAGSERSWRDEWIEISGESAARKMLDAPTFAISEANCEGRTLCGIFSAIC